MLKLTYEADGTPVRRGLAKTREWARDAAAAAQVVSLIQPSIPQTLADFADAIKRHEEDYSGGASTGTILANARSLLDTAAIVRSMGDQLREILGQSRQIETEMREFVEVMEEINAVDDSV